MVRAGATIRKTFSWLGGNTHFLALLIIVAIIGLLKTYYTTSVIEENRKHFESEAAGFLQTLKSEADSAIIRVKDLAALVAAGQELTATASLHTANQTSPYLKESGYLYADNIYTHRSYPDQSSALNPKAPTFSGIVKEMTSRPGSVLTFSPSAYPDAFPTLSPKDIVFAQAVPVAGTWDLRLQGGAGRQLITYSILDLDSIIKNAEQKLESSTIENVEYSSTTGSFSAENTPHNGIIPFLLNKKTEEFSTKLTHDTLLTIGFREYHGSVVGLFYFLLGFAVLALVSGGLFLRFELSARKLRGEQAKAIEDAVEANNAKSEFLATMSHEIRTPLNGILGIAEVLNRTELTPAQMRYTQQIMSSGSMLLGILNDILDMSKLESGMMEIDPVRVNLYSQLLETAGFYFPNARKKQIDLHVDVDHSVPEFVEVDPMRLRQVVNNLLSNAIKFTSEGEVVLSARFVDTDAAQPPANGCLLISVKDSGIGIGQQEMSRLFQRFMQASSSMSRKYGGTGLGLSISSLIAQAMGGSISVDSAPGAGSTFTLRLPVEADEFTQITYTGTERVAVLTSSQTTARMICAAFEPCELDVRTFKYDENALQQLIADADGSGPFRIVIFDEEYDIQRAIDDWQKLKTRYGNAISSIVIGEKQLSKNYIRFDRAIIKPFLAVRLVETAIDLITGKGRRAAADEPLAAAIPFRNAFAGHRMLAVDDSQVNLLVAEELFSDYGFVIDTANDGRKALSKIRQRPYDIVLMDCQMPVMDGYEATRQIRDMMASGEIPRCPIVALTANALKGDREKCLGAGMDEFLAKPMQTEAINEVFVRLLEDPEFAGRLTLKNQPTRTADILSLPVAPTVDVQTTPEEPARTPPVSGTALVNNDELGTDPRAKTPGGGEPASAAMAGDGDKVPLMDLRDFDRTRRAMKKFDTLLAFYQADSRMYLDVLADVFANGKLEDGILPAHTLKSSSKVLGATAVAALAEAMEKRLRSGTGNSRPELNALLLKTNAAFAATLTQIDQAMRDQNQQKVSEAV